jgi:uncharacterized RmlC-like cupin family protein
MGDLVFIPPQVPHEEVNPSADEAAVWLTVWDGGNAFVPLARDVDGVYRPEPLG